MIEVNKEGLVSARELHTFLESKQHFTDWIKARINECDLIKDTDYFTFHKIMKRSKTNEFSLTIYSAKVISILERNDKGKELRKYLIELDNQRTEGKLQSIEEIENLFDLVELFCFDTPRAIAKRKHFITHNNKFTFYQTRAEILGYSKYTLTKALLTIGERYKSEEKALMKINKHALIRMAVIDFLKSLGKSDEYARNIGDMAKTLSVRSKNTFGRWNDKMFLVPDNIKKNLKLLN